MTAPLEVHHLTKRYGDFTAVDDLSFAVPPGICFGLLGPNGAGKTTTLRCCLGLTAPDGGDLRLNGLAVPGQAREARRATGVVPQFDNLDPDFTVAENLLVFGRYFGLEDRLIRSRIPDLLEFAGLGGKGDAPLKSLSGGMKRRLSLARALVNDPAVIFLDEPTTGLDPQARHLIWERLKELTAQGKTLILTTHFMDEAERLCHRLGVVDHGRLVAEGSPAELIAQHIEPQVVEIYGEDAPAWAAAHTSLAPRQEVVGETAFFYCQDPAPLLAAAAPSPGLRTLHRAANLEDVFLKLTGRELRD